MKSMNKTDKFLARSIKKMKIQINTKDHETTMNNYPPTN